MDVKASVDIGKNLTTLLEQLAKQIGTTADKIFPWYVSQSIIEGYTFFFLLLVAFSTGGVFLLLSSKNPKYSDVNQDNPTVWLFVMIAGYILLFSGLIALFAAEEELFDPEFHAMKQLARQLGGLIK